MPIFIRNNTLDKRLDRYVAKQPVRMSRAALAESLIERGLSAIEHGKIAFPDPAAPPVSTASAAPEVASASVTPSTLVPDSTGEAKKNPGGNATRPNCAESPATQGSPSQQEAGR